MTSLIPPGCPTVLTEDDRTGTSIETLRRAFMDNLFFIQGRFPEVATKNDYYLALAYTVRDRLLLRWLNSAKTYRDQESRTVCYLSAEFLLGPHLGNNLINLGLYEAVEEAMRQTGLNLKELLDQEEEPGLGNGGLGRLAACYMDSLATLEIPAIGYGIRYEYGIFDQEIRDGWQVEITDKWLRYGNPWEIPRPELILQVKFGGYTYSYTDDQGRYRVVWQPHQVIQGVAYDTPILGYKVNTANLLRLWRAEAVESFDFQAFNTGDYYGAVNQKIASENITKVLYPNDEQLQGKELRLMQQYFFCSCALQDMIRLYKQSGKQDLSRFHEKFTVQLNDTHPAISVAELMRLFVDEHLMPWEQAWDITRRTFAYTNHTLLPEALEKWPLDLFGSLLPRHLQIIYEINRRFLDEVRLQYPGDNDRLRRLSIIDESDCRYVRMAHLAAVGSHAINGVAALHSELLKKTVLKDFYELTPEKFSNKTNGVTPRRWMVLSNPRLTRLITERIGEDWLKHLDQLRQLEPLAEDAEFAAQWQSVKHGNKERLAEYIRDRLGVTVDPHSLFSILVKRIHEYKRQHLCVLNVITLYQMLKDNPQLEMVPQTFIFGGKAAPGYYMAKLIIKLINSVAEVINRDPAVRDRLRVVFLPNYSVTLGQQVYPAADLSQQISTAGYEASGTGNMKFALNGALTIGTLDGANVEIREEVGAENFFLFGHTVEQLQELWRNGYRPWEFANSNPRLKRVLDLIASGYFSHGDTELFRPLVQHLWQNDRYCLLADYQSYVDCHQRVLQVYQQDQAQWAKMSILNVARMGKFSSDRAIREYCQDIWHVQPVKVVLPATSYLTSPGQ
ncbi:glycogen phosphorylase GlgP [Thermosynechococcus sp. NK55a]|uniref:glycogen/starch/alpha-glucan phosphorylase n=1 Tax=Thermosynechococcus sp. NK55a TaxID=1394889 RepID=UPI0003D96285|nr:glycogen/starch/alpha-glucan phosphorylase [Thermosynechococcus sp. NK55a]AHB88955.1 glycogen phosphorylase GlgP [Thermosynechococcus sp. NK55a]